MCKLAITTILTVIAAGFTVVAAAMLLAGGPPVVVTALAVLAAATLRGALAALDLCHADGIPPVCEGHFQLLRRGYAPAIAAAAVVAGTTALGLPSGITYGALVLAASTLVNLQGPLQTLRDCLAIVARNIGPLEAGERLGDPWFLRVETSVNGAVARVLRRSLPVSFSWTLDGEPIVKGRFTKHGVQSTLSLDTPPRDGLLRVVATDEKGRVVEKAIGVCQPAVRNPSIRMRRPAERPSHPAWSSAS